MKGTGKKNGRKRVSDLKGNLRQKAKSGFFYYRLTIANGQRREFALKTADYDEAHRKAMEIDSVWLAPTPDVAIAQINAIKGFSKKAQNLPFSDVWAKYSVHPLRATPRTVSEQGAYRSTFLEFVEFIDRLNKERGQHRAQIGGVGDITFEVCEKFSDYLKTTNLAVDTHNRKIKRLRKIFQCVKDYYDGENPFRSTTLLRKPSEEQDSIVQRKAFTKDEINRIKEVLADDVHKIINKAELRVAFIIGMYTGQRLKDCVLLQWQNVDMAVKRIWVKQFKTGKKVSIPIAGELYDVLKEAETWRVNQYILPRTASRYNTENKEGKNTGNGLVDIDVLRVIRWIGLEPSVDVPGRKKKMTIYGFHSLRHTFASFCAEAGVPKSVLLSILGTESEIADKYYIHVGDESQRKAIEAISGKISEKSPQDRINEVLTLLAEKPAPSEELLRIIRDILVSHKGDTKHGDEEERTGDN